MERTARDDAPVTAWQNIHPDRELFSEIITINRPRGELYAFGRDIANVAAVVGPVASIVPLDGVRSQWKVERPDGNSASWVAAISEERPGETIFWQAEPGADIDNAGRLDFLDAGVHGTAVRVTLAYGLPQGVLARMLSLRSGEAARAHVRRALRRFKQLMETHEIATALRHRRRQGDRA